jgi:hypothetical protein
MASHLAYKDLVWHEQPDAEAFLTQWLRDLRDRAPRLAVLETQFAERAGVRLRDVVDHIRFVGGTHAAAIEAAGWRADGPGVWRNEDGLFPAFVQGASDGIFVRVESVEAFAEAQGITSAPEGVAHGPLRLVRTEIAPGVELGAVERAGDPGFAVLPVDTAKVRAARLHYSAFKARRRQFDDVASGLAHTERLVDAAVGDIGPHWACDLWLRAERDYWMRRCAAGRLQKARQDAIGIGYSNIDHHTYDGSRAHFRHTVRILEKLGYQLREMLYAGELAGWGSQVLWQPVIRSTIFADVDLSPEELLVDFAHDDLPPLPRHRRAGLLSELLGESILEAGLNHVACLYDQRLLRAQLGERGVAMMAPFSDMPHLYQELTLGDWDAVDPARVDALEAAGHIDAPEAERLRMDGSIVTHLENIERNNGYKGFNRGGIDSVLRKLDPRAYPADGVPA